MLKIYVKVGCFVIFVKFLLKEVVGGYGVVGGCGGYFVGSVCLCWRKKVGLGLKCKMVKLKVFLIWRKSRNGKNFIFWWSNF